MGNHKGCPYKGFVGAYFRSSDRMSTQSKCFRVVLGARLISHVWRAWYHEPYGEKVVTVLSHFG